MGGSVNRAIIVGNLGKDPEVRATQDGKEIATLSVATSERWKDRHTGEQREKTEWHRVVIFNEHLVRVAKDFLRKGSKVFIEGPIQTRKWTDKDGVDRYVTEIVLMGFNSTLTCLDKAPARGDAYEPEQQQAARDPELNDELGF